MDKYLLATWTKNGMDYPNINCWGLVRLVRHELYGLPLLPRLDDLDVYNKRHTTGVYSDFIEKHIQKSEIKPGCIAIAFVGRLCVHVGVVVERDGILMVLDIDEGRSSAYHRVCDFERKYKKVEYYYDRDH